MLTYLTGEGRENSISNGQASPPFEFGGKMEIRPFEQDDEDDVTETVSDTYSETTGDEVVGISSTSEREPSVGADQDTVDSARPAGGIITQQSVEDLKGALPELNEAVRRAVAGVKTSISLQDVKMFARLSKYFTGEHHIEEIMYRENVRRSQLLLLLDKFRDVLITCEKEDADINFFKKEEW
jgi:hypothetical protein